MRPPASFAEFSSDEEILELPLMKEATTHDMSARSALCAKCNHQFIPKSRRGDVKNIGQEYSSESARFAASQKFHYVGVFAVEMFVLPGGELLVNEIAPRVHNSGHWTLDGASISQFEQHIRAIAGWPLGKPVRHGPVTMTNLIGNDIDDYEQWLTVPGATLHLYGKGPPRPGRKMGHVTQVAVPPKTT